MTRMNPRTWCLLSAGKVMHRLIIRATVLGENTPAAKCSSSGAAAVAHDILNLPLLSAPHESVSQETPGRRKCLRRDDGLDQRGQTSEISPRFTGPVGISIAPAFASLRVHYAFLLPFDPSAEAPSQLSVSQSISLLMALQKD